MFQPAYYQGRRVITLRARSHPVNYVYVWVRHQRVSKLGNYREYPAERITRAARLRLVKADAYWRNRRPYPLP